jgi:hypothetical protein
MTDRIDPNHDIVPTLRMFDGVMMNKAADEIERLRLQVAALSRTDTQPVAYEFLHPNGHAIVDYSEHTHVGHLTAEKGYAKLPLVYASTASAKEARDGQQ